MSPPSKPTAWIVAAILGLAVLAAVAMSVASTERDSAFTPGGGGPEALLEDARALGLQGQRSVAGPAALRHDAKLDPSRTLLVVAAPDRPYTDDEARSVKEFLTRGGRLLVADAFGQANSITTPLGFGYERVRLVDEDGEHSATLGGRTYAIGLAEPTAIKILPDAPAEVLAWSSPASFLDRDGDGLIGLSDPHGPFPLVVRLTTGGGLVFAIADAAILDAASADAADNRGLRLAILDAALPDGGTVLIEERHRSEDPTLSAVATALAAAATAPWRHMLAAAAGLLVLGLAAPYVRDRWRAHRFRPDRFVRRSSLAALGQVGPHPPEPRDQPRSHWTPRGVAAIIAGLALTIGTLLLGSAEAGYAAAAMLAAVALAALPRLPRIEARRKLSTDRVDEGSPVEVALEVRARARSPELEFRDHVPEEFEVKAGTHWFRATPPNGQPLPVAYTVSPALRGPYVVGPLHVRLEDSLGLHIQEAHFAHPLELRVNPRRESVRKTPFRTRVPTITLGPHLVNRAGDGSEFHALRTYQTGDSYRSVNWKASARSKDLMVNQRVHESMARLTIFLDARAVSAAGPAAASPLAQGCRAVLSVAAGALRVRDRIRVVVYGNGIQELPTLPGSRQLHGLTDLLAGLPAAGSLGFGPAVAQVAPSLAPGTPAMLCSGLEADGTVAEGMRLLRARGLLPFAVVPPLGTAPTDPEEGGPEPGAAQLTESRRSTMMTLQALGVPVFDAVPDVPLDYLFRTGGGL